MMKSDGKEKGNSSWGSTEEAILHAAEEEFLHNGYAGARTVSIARKAGVTHAMLHYYFRSKEHLFQQVLRSKITQMAESILIIFGDSSLPLLQRIENGVRKHFEILGENPGLPMFILNEATSNKSVRDAIREAVAQRAGTMLEMLQKDIDRAADEGVCERVPAMMLVMDILAVNLFSFLVPSIFNEIPESDVSMEEFMEMKKEENVRLITKRLSI